MYRVVIWHSHGHMPGLTKGFGSGPLPLEDAISRAAELRALYCCPGGGLHSVGIEAC